MRKRRGAFYSKLFFYQYLFNFSDIHRMVIFVRIPFLFCTYNQEAFWLIFLGVEFSAYEHGACFFEIGGCTFVYDCQTKYG